MNQKKNEPSTLGPSRSLNGIDPSGLVTADDTPPSRDANGRIRRPGPWTAVPSHIARNRAFMGLSLQARFLYVIGWLYCNRERTDGRLVEADFRNVAAEAQLTELEAKAAVAELVGASLWAAGYEVAGFLNWNLSAAEIEGRAAENVRRVREYRANHRPAIGVVPESEKVSPDPFQRQNTQNTQIRNGLRNALQEGIGEPDVVGTTPTNDLTPEAILHGQEQAQRLRDATKKGLPSIAPVAVNGR